MMSLDRNALVQALDTFADAKPSDGEVDLLLRHLGGSKDILCHVLLETDFLSRYPEVAKILRGLSGPVSRSVLTSPDKAVLSARMTRTLLQELHDKQKRWASKAQELTELEAEISQLKVKIGALRGAN
ncbi:hypothetical protein [Azospirillum sp. SYSU D00513]|uniref:hypothetical protein n=1 Tax=Azospirillum sp. SYSU D00513 TaxID=2812561 RepID=UPI001A9577C9|nr:hypothetical protein [Azospirillum sp. SYSU D00513]